MVTFAVAGIVLGAALTVTLSSREFYESDQRRTDVNQNLRSALDLVGIDVRQAGARLPDDFPALEIVDGGGDAPDRLLVRRNLLHAVLPVCAQLDQGAIDTEVRAVFSDPLPPAGCSPVLDDDANGWPDNLDEWRRHRDANGGAVPAYLFNPIDQVGEFFLYDGDGSTDDYLHKGNGDSWLHDYRIDQQCRIYMLEQRTYELDGEVLRYVLNDGGAGGVNLVTRIIGFQARAVFSDGTVQESLGTADEWRDLQSIEISLTGEIQQDGRVLNRTVTARFFPRNILSL